MKNLIIAIFLLFGFTSNCQVTKYLLLSQPSSNMFYVGTGGVATSAGTSVSIAYPTNIVANDILLLHAAERDLNLPGTPTGWTPLGGDPSELPELFSHAWFYKRATGSESGNLSVTITAAIEGAGIIYNYRNVSTAATPYHSNVTGNIGQPLSTIINGTSTSASDFMVVLWVVETASATATSTGTNWVADSEISTTANGGWRFEAQSFPFSSITTSNSIDLTSNCGCNTSHTRLIFIK